jgi:hypothetical protein
LKYTWIRIGTASSAITSGCTRDLFSLETEEEHEGDQAASRISPAM